MEKIKGKTGLRGKIRYQVSDHIQIVLPAV